MARWMVVCALVAPAGAAWAQEIERANPLRYESLRGNIRAEVHMLPPVSTGPLHPTWSPDGAWLAFAMAGDIWRVPAAGGPAEQLTTGPWYHFEPAWSPTGTHIAMTVETGDGLDIALLDLETGSTTQLTSTPGVAVQPAWGPAGQWVYFSSDREGSLDVFRIDATGEGAEELVAGGRGNQIQPSVSPQGTLAWVAPVEGLSGSGGIWRAAEPGAAPELIHAEETSYRARPAWHPDGARLVFVTDEGGSNDLALLAADGGNPLRLSGGTTHEITPAISPDGTRIAFTSSVDGTTALYTMALGGGPDHAWRPVDTSERVYRGPIGRLAGRVTGPDGNTMAARVTVVASDGRSYGPRNAFHRVLSTSETHYFRTMGDFVVEIPP